VAAAACGGLAASACILGIRDRPRAAAAALPKPTPSAVPAKTISPATTAAPAAAWPTPSPTPKAGFPLPNELGRVPILMYHSVGEHGAYDRHGLNIPPGLFRRHLQLLHDNGFCPVNVRDLLSPRLNVPAGKSPVAITFDDARGSQFRLRKDGSIDPDCAVGILDAFHTKYGDAWPQRATFFVLPASKYNPAPFWQPGLERAKIDYLVGAGYEVANHSTSHHPMSSMDAVRLTWEEKTCREYFQRLAPGATMDTLAVPYGIFPRSMALRDVLINGGARCLLMAWGDASYAPADKRFDRRAVMRIGSEPGVVENWIKALVRDRRRNGPLRPFISDGDPDTLTVPKSMAKYADPERLDGVRLVAYGDPALVKPKPARGKALATR
jgi:peptidoglycan/xylan/chitin deacetylase (PgdA/CDA1 family)